MRISSRSESTATTQSYVICSYSQHEGAGRRGSAREMGNIECLNVKPKRDGIYVGLENEDRKKRTKIENTSEMTRDRNVERSGIDYSSCSSLYGQAY